MKNIYLLPTDKPSRLYLSFNNELNLDNYECQNTLIHKNQNICITSEEEIKEGDWYLTNKNTLCKCIKTDSKYVYSLEGGSNTNCEKIIITTDQELINDGVQAIDDEFLEWFVKNPSCEEVEIEESYSMSQFSYSGIEYEIIIPKEEPYNKVQQKSLELNKKFAENNDLEKIMSEFDEPKQETPEEVADRFFEEQEKLNFSYDSKESFAEGYKLAQEQNKKMYNEEEVLNIIQFFNDDFNMIHDTIPKWFKQFKK